MSDAQGRRIFLINSQTFLIVAEGKMGTSGLNPATRLQPPTPPLPPLPGGRPDLQIESMHDLGNGDPVIMCDSGNFDGVPHIDPPDFGPDMLPSKDISSALIDFSCRFNSFDPSVPCTLNSSGNSGLGNSSANPSIQFCSSRLGFGQAFPVDDTMLTLRLRDGGLNLGPPVQIIVRVVPPP